VHLQQEPHAAAGSGTAPQVGSSDPVDAIGSSPLSSAGYQQYLQQQQQLLMPPHQQQQQQQEHQLPLDSWAGLMNQSTLENLEELIRRSSSGGGGSSGSSGGSRRPRSQGNWDEDWEGPSINDDELPGRSRLMGRLHG
jgi:hypothetical protein